MKSTGLGFLLCATLFACSSSKNEGSPGGDADAGAGEDAATADAAPTCPSTPATDPLSAQRDACTFAAGAKAADTLGFTDEMRQAMPIKHVIVLMKENRSFDHLFGQLSKQGQPDAEAVPSTFAPADKDGKPVAPFHQTTTCVQYDPPHQWDNMHAQCNGGKMDGFVTSATQSTPASDGTFVMGYYDNTDIPFYYWLANTYSIADRYFPSVLSGTWSNRDYLVAGTSHGTKNTSTDPQLDGVPLIFDKLDTAGVSWGVYSDDIAPLEFSVKWGSRKAYQKVDALLASLADGTLPSVVFVDATTNFALPQLDEHPTGDVQAGEAWTKTLYDAVVKSPKWNETAMFFTYDEAGGFADHVPPPKSCAPSADQAEFTELGMRVPLIVISPWARRHFVSHQVHQHTSILRFIETLFDVPALTARDANSDALLDMFDFTCGNKDAIGDAPAAGTGKCASK